MKFIVPLLSTALLTLALTSAPEAHAGLVEYDDDLAGFNAAITGLNTTVIDFESLMLGTSVITNSLA